MKKLDRELFRDINKSFDEIKSGKFIEFTTVTEFKKKLQSYNAN